MDKLERIQRTSSLGAELKLSAVQHSGRPGVLLLPGRGPRDLRQLQRRPPLPCCGDGIRTFRVSLLLRYGPESLRILSVESGKTIRCQTGVRAQMCLTPAASAQREKTVECWVTGISHLAKFPDERFLVKARLALGRNGSRPDATLRWFPIIVVVWMDEGR